MGEVIFMEQRRRGRPAASVAPLTPRRGARPSTSFSFDLSSAATYLAAERVERGLPHATWRPVLAEAIHPGAGERTPAEREAGRRGAEDRATALRMPLVWPEGHPAGGRAAMRVAHFAAERGQAAAFVLAAGRLAFCGGFDLDDPEILMEAVAAAALPLEECLTAAGDRSRDAAMSEEGQRLIAQGADLLPTVRVGRLLFCGEARIAEAVAATRDPIAERRAVAREG